jgi:hypothetical protein
MGFLSWALEHNPQSRMNRVIYDLQDDGITAGFRSLGHETIGFSKDAAFVAAVLLSRGGSLVAPNNVISSILKEGIYYDPGKVDMTSFGITGYYMKQQLEQSRGQDGKLGGVPPSVPPKTPRGTKPSRPIRSGLTSKPFWSKGKPKCKKGFRYDYKRKLCVKIK